jgi:hypothetical protein
MFNRRAGMKRWSLIAGLLLSAPLLNGASAVWQSLMDGRTLNGWRPDGQAGWTVENGAILGRQGPGAAGGNLYTLQQWANFELELEFRVRWPANSGIWFRRSESQPGYQADILDQPSYPDTFSGSLWAMGAGFLAKNTDPNSVRKDEWNRLRIRAACEAIIIGLNGKAIVKTSDRRFQQPGSIGIEVHPGEQFRAMEISVRQIRLKPVECKQLR